jgi:anti-sigma28 factor (negative regulator of flagellin synthesis)
MMGQILPVPRAFNRPQRRCWRAVPSLPATRSRSSVGVQTAWTGRTHQFSAQFCNPNPYARADKIAHLRRAVENGDYCVSPEQIAEKMAREALVAMFTS